MDGMGTEYMPQLPVCWLSWNPYFTMRRCISLTISDRPTVILKAFQQHRDELANGGTKTVPWYLRRGAQTQKMRGSWSQSDREKCMLKGMISITSGTSSVAIVIYTVLKEAQQASRCWPCSQATWAWSEAIRVIYKQLWHTCKYFPKWYWSLSRLIEH